MHRHVILDSPSHHRLATDGELATGQRRHAIRRRDLKFLALALPDMRIIGSTDSRRVLCDCAQNGFKVGG